jgi:putative addiction module antidote
MMKLKVRKIGNSLGVVLPKEAVSRLHADEGDHLFLIEGPNGVYQLTPHDPEFERKMKKAENIIDRYRNTLHSLSKWENRSGLTNGMGSRSMIDFWRSMVVPLAFGTSDFFGLLLLALDNSMPTGMLPT